MVHQQSASLRLAAVEEIIQLRRDVLIIGTDRTSPEFDGDHGANTRHFGAFIEQSNICCLSWMLSEIDEAPAWQLRGMATHPNDRGSGVGRELLKFSENYVASESEIRQFWCNARTGAVGFYQKQGWLVCSDEFLISGVGPHFKMKKTFHANA
ncbi:MAG: GNAT family N-acetyltransferase [Candidatus Hinthialibacter antarcticus]|nr:GNAT family N-acetyltransferase [Candidatus Hinthialibacter antarcticus]